MVSDGLQSNREEQTLTNLGLTPSEAKVYLALVHNGPSKVIPISQASGIHRAHLYEILRSLEENGLVDRTLETGVFTATPLKEIAPLLIKRKQEEIATLEKQVNAIADSEPYRNSVSQEKREIVLTSNKNRTLNQGQKYFEAAIGQIDSMHTWKRFAQFYEYFETLMNQLMARGIKLREIVEFPRDRGQAEEFLKRKIFQHKNFVLRFVDKTGGNFNLIDGKMLLMSTTVEKENLAETPFIFANYEGLLGIMNNYFQLAWGTASDFTALSAKS